VINNSGFALVDWLHDCSARNLFSPCLGRGTFELALVAIRYMHAGAWIRTLLKTQALFCFSLCCKMMQASHLSVNSYSNEPATAYIFTIGQGSGCPERLVLAYQITGCYRNLSNEMLSISRGRSSIDSYTRCAHRVFRPGGGGVDDHEAIYKLILKIML
jgi:hypothetical protein